MSKGFNFKFLGFQAAFFVGMWSQDAAAQTTGGNDFSDIAENITSSISELPGMISGIAYLMGMLLGVMGVMKVKDHVENPSQTPLKDGAVRLAAGGALFGLPIVFESMQNTIGLTSAQIAAPQLNRVEFNVR